MSRPNPSEHVPYFSRYIDLVPDGDLAALLQSQHEATQRMLAPLTPQQARFRYAEGKWSVAETIGHLADSERIFAYRALRFARRDATPLHGYDDEGYVRAGRFDERPFADLLREFAAVRAATLALYRGTDAESLLASGVGNDNPVSVRALFYVIAGHERHHVNVLHTRYGIPLPR
jgi:uncharacterized damage-inducible protein DinB